MACGRWKLSGWMLLTSTTVILLRYCTSLVTWFASDVFLLFVVPPVPQSLILHLHLSSFFKENKHFSEVVSSLQHVTDMALDLGANWPAIFTPITRGRRLCCAPVQSHVIDSIVHFIFLHPYVLEINNVQIIPPNNLKTGTKLTPQQPTSLMTCVRNMNA